MSSPMIITLASVFISMFEPGCGGQVPHMATTEPTDPIAFAEPFHTVCKVGERGGDGTLIAPNWVLTAGHVADGMFRRTGGKLRVYFDNGTVHQAVQVFLHPKFEPMGRYDLALLQLDGTVEGLGPSPLYTGSDELHALIFLVGHGDKRNVDGSWIKDGQLRAYTNIVDEVNDTHLVFDYDAPGGNGTEQEGTSGPGDSGGPAFILTDGRYAVAGVSSMGEPGADGPCSYGAVEHFVRVSRFVDWIAGVMRDPSTHPALGPDTASSSIAKEVRVNSGSGATLGDTPRERAAHRIVTGLGTGDEARIIEAINATYDPAILAKRDARAIMANMPALIRQLSGATLVEVLAVTGQKISLKLDNNGVTYVLDLYFLPWGKVEQMAFGRIG